MQRSRELSDVVDGDLPKSTPVMLAVLHLAQQYATIRKRRPSAIVFGGGGYKGLSFASAMMELVQDSPREWSAMTAHLQIVAGVSAGSIAAFLLVSGLRMDQIQAFVHSTCMTVSLGAPSIECIMKQCSLLDNSGLRKVLSNMFSVTGMPESITFQGLYELCGVRFRVYVANLTHQRLECWDHVSHPDERVFNALLISCSACPVFPRIRHRGCVYADGGIFAHSPGLGDSLYPEDTLFLFIREPLCLEEDWLSQLSLLITSYSNGQAITSASVADTHKNIVTIVSSLGVANLIKGAPGEETFNIADAEGRAGMRAYLDKY